MKNNSPKRIAFKTLIKYKHYLLNSSNDLQRIIESNQFTIIKYNKHANSKPVSELINRLGVENEIEQSDSFLYINNNLKFLFINEDVSDQDRCSLLRHELGHICDPDLKNSNIQSSKIKKEEFANEFSYYIKNPGICFMIYVFLIKKWKLLVGILSLITFVLGLLYIINIRIVSREAVTSDASSSVISDSAYYVTSSGKKYHQKHCIIIKYKNNLKKITLNEAIDDGYKPCLICNPDEK